MRKNINSSFILLVFISISYTLSSPIQPNQNNQVQNHHPYRILLEKQNSMYLFNVQESENSTDLIGQVNLEDSHQFSVEIDTYSIESWVPGPLTHKSNTMKCHYPCTVVTHNLPVQNFSTPGALISTSQKITGDQAIGKLTLGKLVVESFPFVLVSSVNNTLRSSEGVISLAYQENRGLLYLMQKQGLITQQEFSAYLGKDLNFFTIGNYNNYLVDSNSLTVFYSTVVNSKWALSVEKMFLDGKIAPNSVLAHAGKAYIDLANEGIYFPAGGLDAFLVYLNSHFGSNSACSITNKIVYCDCKHFDSFPAFGFEFQSSNKTFTIDKENLIFKNASNNLCITQFGESTLTEGLVIGRAFARNYIMIFNQNSKSIKIGKVYDTSIEGYKIDNGIKGLVIGLGLAFIVVSILALIYILKPVITDSNPAQKAVRLR